MPPSDAQRLEEEAPWSKVSSSARACSPVATLQKFWRVVGNHWKTMGKPWETRKTIGKALD